MCGGVLTLTSGSTMRGWFSPDLHTLWLGELTKWSQVNPAVRDSINLTIMSGRVTGPGAVEEGEAGGESLHSSIRVMKQHVTNPAHCSKIL